MVSYCLRTPESGMEHDTAGDFVSTLDTLVNDMARIKNFDEKFNEQLRKTVKAMSDNTDVKNEEVLKQFKIFKLEKAKSQKEIEDLETDVKKEGIFSPEGSFAENLMNKLKAKSQGKLWHFVLITMVIIIGVCFKTQNMGMVLRPFETMANTFGCQDYGQVKRAREDECMITWSYQGNLHDIKWKFTGICTDWCTGYTETVLTQSRGGAIEHCIKNLYQRLKNLTYESKYQSCSECGFESDDKNSPVSFLK